MPNRVKRENSDNKRTVQENWEGGFENVLDCAVGYMTKLYAWFKTHKSVPKSVFNSV